MRYLTEPITEVENGIPVPPRAQHVMDPDKFLQRNRTYPFYSLQVGQSFLVPLPITADTSTIHRRRNTLASMACRVTKRLGWIFTVRFVATEGIRVWRTA